MEVPYSKVIVVEAPLGLTLPFKLTEVEATAVAADVSASGDVPFRHLMENPLCITNAPILSALALVLYNSRCQAWLYEDSSELHQKALFLRSTNNPFASLSPPPFAVNPLSFVAPVFG